MRSTAAAPRRIALIQIAYPQHCGVSSGGQSVFPAIATDPQGNLFVAVYTYDGGAATRAHAKVSPGSSTRVPCNGVAIFAPDANGSVNPIQSIGFGRGAFIDAIAVDAADNLYVGNYPHNIVQYANAVNSPKRRRVFHTRSPAHVSSLAIDAAGEIFISNTNFGYQTAWIDRYAADAKAKGPPTSEIQLAGVSHLHMLYSIAVRGRDLYAVDGCPERRSLSRTQERSADSFPFVGIGCGTRYGACRRTVAGRSFNFPRKSAARVRALVARRRRRER